MVEGFSFIQGRDISKLPSFYSFSIIKIYSLSSKQQKIESAVGLRDRRNGDIRKFGFLFRPAKVNLRTVENPNCVPNVAGCLCPQTMLGCLYCPNIHQSGLPESVICKIIISIHFNSWGGRESKLGVIKMAKSLICKEGLSGLGFELGRELNLNPAARLLPMRAQKRFHQILKLLKTCRHCHP